MLLLILSAILPAAFLLVRIYRADRLEPEPARLLVSLVLWGIAATFLALVTEGLGQALLSALYPVESLPYRLLFNFLVVAGSEEGFKYLLLRRKTWEHPAFNCQFDGVVYAVYVSLGFALWENIGYVLNYGFSTAVARALTAVPGHACFGVFMGAWYGHAKRYENYGDPVKSRRCRRMAFWMPLLLHGLYDFIAGGETISVLAFLALIVLMFVISYRLVRRLASEDQYISSRNWWLL